MKKLLDFTEEIESLVHSRFTFSQLEKRLHEILGVSSDLLSDVEQNATDYQFLMGIDQNGLYGYIDIYYLKTRESLNDREAVYYITEVNVSED